MTFTHTIQYLQLENYMMSLHELADLENEFENQTIVYESTNKFNTHELKGLLEDAINQDRSPYSKVEVAYAEYPMNDTANFALSF